MGKCFKRIRTIEKGCTHTDEYELKVKAEGAMQYDD